MLDIAGTSDGQRVHLSCRLDMYDAEGHIGMCMSNLSPREPVACDSRISHYAKEGATYYNALIVLCT
jgi:hypothetical protein